MNKKINDYKEEILQDLELIIAESGNKKNTVVAKIIFAYFKNILKSLE